MISIVHIENIKSARMFWVLLKTDTAYKEFQLANEENINGSILFHVKSTVEKDLNWTASLKRWKLS